MTTWAPCVCGSPMRDGTCCCSYCVGAYDHQPDAPDHRAAIAGCVGTGEHWPCPTWQYTGLPAEFLEGISCTADDAVRGAP